jgi:hypothetical protein
MYFSGGESTSIQIHANKEGILGPSDLQLRCDYTLDIGKRAIGSNIQAKFNDMFKNIATFEKDSNDADPIDNNTCSI